MISMYQPLTGAADDASLIRMWLSGKRSSTQFLYTRTVEHFLDFVGVSLADVRLEDLTQWMESLFLRGCSQNTIALKVSVVKSLFSYAWKVGYLNLNVTAAVVTPSAVSALHERILQQGEVKKLINAASPGRDRSVLTLIYSTGLRASEALGIDWFDLKPRSTGGQVTVLGKGGKVRTVLISSSLWEQLQALPRHDSTGAVFVTNRGNRLDRHQLHRIIKAAANRAGINPHVSTHWLRHAHACHSLENGCDVDVSREEFGSFKPDHHLQISPRTTGGGF